MQLAIIGTGNMGQAILEGVIRRQIVVPSDIRVFDTDRAKSAAISERTGVRASETAVVAIQNADVIILATKPDVCARALMPLQGHMTEKQVLVSIAAGLTLEHLRQMAGSAPILVRAMPNTPALVGCGVSALAFEQADDAVKASVGAIFESFGSVHFVTEKMMDAITGLSGSGPAFMMLILEAMADAGVYMGLPRDLALKMAGKTMEGSARLMLETGTHPGVLKDQVCSPGGTTIEGVRVLEEKGLRAAIFSAVTAAGEKSVKMRSSASSAANQETGAPKAHD